MRGAGWRDGQGREQRMNAKMVSVSWSVQRQGGGSLKGRLNILNEPRCLAGLAAASLQVAANKCTALRPSHPPSESSTLLSPIRSYLPHPTLSPPTPSPPSQVLSALLCFISPGGAPLSFDSTCRVSSRYWAPHASPSSPSPLASLDAVLRVRGSQLVTGVLDKSQFGRGGVVHCCEEVYGAKAAGLLLSCLSRLLTAFLQVGEGEGGREGEEQRGCAV